MASRHMRNHWGPAGGSKLVAQWNTELPKLNNHCRKEPGYEASPSLAIIAIGKTE